MFPLRHAGLNSLYFTIKFGFELLFVLHF